MMFVVTTENVKTKQVIPCIHFAAIKIEEWELKICGHQSTANQI